jgi:YgiT-type zinc finger domain-containing protein
MICLICRQAEITDSRISFPLLRGEMILTVKHVPAYVCPGCGEGYLEEEITMKLLQGAEAVFHSGTIEKTCDYEELISGLRL